MKIKAGIVTASDRCSRGLAEDRSGLELRLFLGDLGAELVSYQVVPDDVEVLKQVLVRLADELHCEVILTTGGTGLGPRDVTPEATRSVIEREAPGISEALRNFGLQKTPLAALSRGIAGVRGRTLIVNLPGSPGAVSDACEFLKGILPHALKLLGGELKDCSPDRRLAANPPDSLPFCRPSTRVLGRPARLCDSRASGNPESFSESSPLLKTLDPGFRRDDSKPLPSSSPSR